MDTEALSDYGKTYLSYKGKFSGEQGLQSWIQDNIDTLLGQNQNEATRGTIRVLSLGAGTGDKDSVIMELLSGKFNSIEYTALEPSPELAEQCKQTLTRPEWRDQAQVTVLQLTSEQFIAANSSTTAQKYDLIHVINTFYYVEDVPSHVKFYYNLLTPGGKMLIINSSANVGFNKILNDFRDNLPSHIVSFAEDVEDGLKSISAPFDTHVLRFTVDLTGCQEDTPSGNLLLDFRTGAKDVRKTLSKELLAKLFKRMGDDSIGPAGSFVFESLTKLFVTQNIASR